MKCPIDNVDLVMSERHGIEIDYCPKCRGVWLDRGELDKIIEKASPISGQTASQQAYQPAPYRGERDNDRYRSEHRPKKKREGFLGDIFDF